MDDKIKTAPAEATETAGKLATPEKSSKPTFTLDRLRQDCRKLFGVTTSTFDGATLGLSDEFTVEEMRARIKSWQDKPVFPAVKKEGK